MIISETQQPPVGGMGGSIHSWERSVDPWHADAFPSHLRYAGTTGERKAGWDGLDWCGNTVCFVPDGTEIEGAANE
jgi:hypothetical protein